MGAPIAMIVQKIIGRATGRMQDFQKGNYAEAFIPLPREIVSGITGNDKETAVPLEDPEQRALASYAKRRRRAYATGTAQASNRAALLQAMKTGQERATKIGVGTKGLRQQRAQLDTAMLGITQQEIAGEQAFAQQEQQVMDTVIQRKLELAMLKNREEKAQATQDTKESKANNMQMLAKLMPTGETNPDGTGGQEVKMTNADPGSSGFNVQSPK